MRVRRTSCVELLAKRRSLRQTMGNSQSVSQLTDHGERRRWSSSAEKGSCLFSDCMHRKSKPVCVGRDGSSPREVVTRPSRSTASIRAVTIDTTMLGLSAWQVRERKRARGDCSLEFPAVVSEFS